MAESTHEYNARQSGHPREVSSLSKSNLFLQGWAGKDGDDLTDIKTESLLFDHS